MSGLECQLLQRIQVNKDREPSVIGNGFQPDGILA